MTRINRFILISMLFIYPFNFVQASSINEKKCEVQGIVFGFFNGVLTTEIQAKDALNKLKKIHGNKNEDGEPIKYELVYNYSNGFEDFVETFEQRLREQEGLLAERYELFFESLHGGGDWWSIIISAVPSAIELRDELTDFAQAAAVEILTKFMENPPTLENYSEQQTRIDTWITEGKKLLFVAHSQGNLFVNVAYDYALTQNTREEAVKVVHIAPASPTLRGEYVLADLDLVINGLRIVGTVPDITELIPSYLFRPAGLNGEKDFLGHGLLEIYMNPNLQISTTVKDYIDDGLNSLEPPSVEASTGLFTATLIWSGLGDVDLSILEPLPLGPWDLVNFEYPIGESGYLDTNNTTGYGPERYLVSCDPNIIQTGLYVVYFSNYKHTEGETATVQISSWDKGVLGSKDFILEDNRWIPGDSGLVKTFFVYVTKNKDSDEYKIRLVDDPYPANE
ncbi:hypothetical protein EIJ81_18800 [Aliivibrio salmonicida]|uniref:Membrane protein n=1 Tax=Aliivibrio salmonicida (strain LFI1238) TaxID=316275 RepID=B6EQN9_ALISL|nr:hypothetical protein [Aliivibrio salmonicida]AZL86438.1 hypothetical protein EIJ81_18800 [Aliivibrio salmonicida]CAQ81016.1 membrane protein [Aliivibrio salmonicida LFI1238]